MVASPGHLTSDREGLTAKHQMPITKYEQLVAANTAQMPLTGNFGHQYAALIMAAELLTADTNK